jgi:hypothetical protein
VGLLAQVVVDQRAAAGLGRQLEGEPAVEAAGTQQRGVEPSARFVAAMSRMLVGTVAGRLSCGAAASAG